MAMEPRSSICFKTFPGVKMDTGEIVDLCSDDEGGNVDPKAVQLALACHRPNLEENKSSSGLYTCHTSSGVLEQNLLPVDDGLSNPSPICAAPLSRMFWKAGNSDNKLGSKVRAPNAKNYLHVHPMFLHSNATSHKWAFGALAELLDNAVDEIQNGATYVIVDKTSNPKDRSPALLIQDDGGGMDPEAMRHCMSFGFSDRKSKFAIGQYGNGFKTGCMRLGADAIVFSCHLNDSILTRSIGLLSYTYLTQTQLDRIVVPMVSYESNLSTGSLVTLNSPEHFLSNLTMLLHWSPFSSEKELLKQFDDIGCHGTKIIIYNLWFNDDDNLELDFDMDPEDICIGGDFNRKKVDTPNTWKAINEQHIANRFRYSLRDYLSILYLRLPETFSIILRGHIVKLHNIADDLKFPDFILYRPQCRGSDEVQTVITIGFLKEAPEVNLNGFNIYHKNRLILPFWQVVTYTNSRGRGVAGVLQADFIQPTHNKQDFERTFLFLKLEARLKEMTWEYWDCHCHLIGYQKRMPRSRVRPIDTSPLGSPPGFEKPQYRVRPVGTSLLGSPPGFDKPQYRVRPVDTSPLEPPPGFEQRQSRARPINTSPLEPPPGFEKPVELDKTSCTQSRADQASLTKRMIGGGSVDLHRTKRQAREENVTSVGCDNQNMETVVSPTDQVVDERNGNLLLQTNNELRAESLNLEKSEEELNLKVAQLRNAVQEAKFEYNRLLAEVQTLDIKPTSSDNIDVKLLQYLADRSNSLG